ncbi:MAG: DNA mismatch repair protein MutS [Actinophytocola sp.]|uniref:MutS-related protein n=1 Tax=Actinophytocola sp. TaxID=1872138 RepID=UPI00132808D6|nr:hypothetical protein [Actinophytocola sp.]MPZ85340.1 DNA mismatch repair protein MutS [Actinophytocola sp.]
MARFQSILFERAVLVDELSEPEFFGDLNLDQVVAAVTAGRGEYDLTPFFYAPLRDVAAVHYRHEVLRDLQRDAVREPVERFASSMREMRAHLDQAGKLRYRYQKQRWFLYAVATYSAAVVALRDRLAAVEVASRGFREFREYLGEYVGSPRFRGLVADTRERREDLDRIRYCVHIRGARVRISRYEDESDYSLAVSRTFAKFRQGTVKERRFTFAEPADMNHVEAQVLEGVTTLFSETFAELTRYREQHADFLDRPIETFDREVQFYLAWLDYGKRFTAAGLALTLPRVSTRDKRISAEEAYDLALATKVVPAEPVVCNDFRLDDGERIIVVTGPNQGGKTTFARMFGQLTYLASLGCPVPAIRASLFLPDRLFSHFEREESLATLRGKLDDELVRIHDIISRATGRSVIVMNESFASTTLNDALFIGTEVLNRIIALGSLAVYVTFVDELASLSDTTVSMVGGVVPDDPARRTYQIARRPADGLAYAAAIATKYGLDHDTLRRRVAR